MTLPLVVVLLVLLGSLVFIVWVVAERPGRPDPDARRAGSSRSGRRVAAIAVGSLVGMWRAASRAEGGRAFGLALVGGLAGLAAIGSFTVGALLTMVLEHLSAAPKRALATLARLSGPHRLEA